MMKLFATKTYSAPGEPDSVRDYVLNELREAGYTVVDESSDMTLLRYPQLYFSSKRPLTCVSLLRVHTEQSGDGRAQVTLDVTFTKVRWFTIALMLVVCGLLPAGIGYITDGDPMPPMMALLGIPIGVLLHFHVRWRVFTRLHRLVFNAGHKSQMAREREEGRVV